MAVDVLAQTIRRETEALIGRLVMQNTSLTAQMNALTESLDAARVALAESEKALAAARHPAAAEEIVP